MTTLRRQRRGPLAALVAALILAASAVMPGRIGQAATTEHVVVDRYSGLALYGYDPVAYFTDRAAKTGIEGIEWTYRGVAWRFCNEGNRAAFARDPGVYMPRFGGHDPVGIASHVIRDGHPEFWAIHGKRLYLFYSEEARTAFAADPDGILGQAVANWPQLSRTLVP